MYFVMRYDRELTDAASAMEAQIIPGCQDLVFDNGTKITQPLPIFDYGINADGQGRLTDYLWTPRPIVLSAKFKETLDAAGVDNVDYYPVRIINQVTGETRTDYFQANVLGIVACLDEAGSQIQYFSPPLPGRPPSILEISHMVVDEAKIADELLFRMARPRPICLAHEKVKIAVEKANLTGVVFLPATGYVWP